MKMFTTIRFFFLLLAIYAPQAVSGQAIVHDSEYYVLEAQNGEKWAADDKVVDAKLAAFRAKNGGKPPNILYILIDDIGFGDLGIPELNAIRGYKTPNINEFAQGKECASHVCTPSPPAHLPGSPS